MRLPPDLLTVALCAGMLGCAATGPGAAPPDARAQVMATERAFAKTTAGRDPSAFATFIADEAIFFSGPRALRGKAQVVAAWAGFYADAAAPFSWEPDQVEVLDSGGLAISSGPVRDPGGTVVARFTSIWRRTSAGSWQIVFDKGNDVCRCAAP